MNFNFIDKKERGKKRKATHNIGGFSLADVGCAVQLAPGDLPFASGTCVAVAVVAAAVAAAVAVVAAAVAVVAAPVAVLLPMLGSLPFASGTFAAAAAAAAAAAVHNPFPVESASVDMLVRAALQDVVPLVALAGGAVVGAGGAVVGAGGAAFAGGGAVVGAAGAAVVAAGAAGAEVAVVAVVEVFAAAAHTLEVFAAAAAAAVAASVAPLASEELLGERPLAANGPAPRLLASRPQQPRQPQQPPQCGWHGPEQHVQQHRRLRYFLAASLVPATLADALPLTSRCRHLTTAVAKPRRDHPWPFLQMQTPQRHAVV